MTLKYLEDNQSKRIDLDTLPEQLEAIPISVKEGADENKRDCLYVEFAYGDSNFTQKYSPYHYVALIEAFKTIKVDGWEDAVNQGMKLRLKKKHFGMGFARFIPVAVV